MSVYRYPPEVHEFVKAHCRGMRDDDLAEACNAALGTEFTKSSMHAFRYNYGYKNGLPQKNERPVGTVTVNKKGYLLRKKQMEGTIWERWEFLHRAVWEEHNGPVPEGMIVTFKDGDRSNCDISNLMLVSRGELAVRNKLFGEIYATPGEPSNEALLRLAQLRRTIVKKEGKKHA